MFTLENGILSLEIPLEIQNGILSLEIHLTIPENERYSATWNNLGVEFDHFALPAKSVDAYQKAIAMSGTLAMCNLAGKSISAGFLSEAQRQCDEALAIPDYHKNIGGILARLKGLPDKEETKKEECFLQTIRTSFIPSRTERSRRTLGGAGLRFGCDTSWPFFSCHGFV